MSARKKSTDDSWDPDTPPEWPDEVWDRAQISIGGKVIREATGTLTKRGRPPVGDEPKQQVTLRLAPRVIRYFKESGDGWQTRLNETLEEYVTAAIVADVKRKSVRLGDLLAADSDAKRQPKSTTTLPRTLNAKLSQTKRTSKAPRCTGTNKH